LPAAERAIKKIEELKMDKLPICVAKTQYSFPTIQPFWKAAGVCHHSEGNKAFQRSRIYCGNYRDIMTMPGLPKFPPQKKSI